MHPSRWQESRYTKPSIGVLRSCRTVAGAMMNSVETHTCAYVEYPGKDATIAFRDAPTHWPAPGRLLVKLKATGIWYGRSIADTWHKSNANDCRSFSHSDCHSIYGTTPMSTHIAGHEGVGEVMSGKSSSMHPTLEPSIADYHCFM